MPNFEINEIIDPLSFPLKAFLTDLLKYTASLMKRLPGDIGNELYVKVNKSTLQSTVYWVGVSEVQWLSQLLMAAHLTS